MSQYIHFTEQQKTQARQTDIAELLRSQGETLKRSGSEYEWLDGGQKVTIRGNLWYHQYDQVGGDAIDFVRRFYNKLYPEAMEYLLGETGGTLTVSPPVQKEEKNFVLPPKNDNMRRVFAYLLNRRGIDREVLYAFVHKGMIYESADYHKLVYIYLHDRMDNEKKAWPGLGTIAKDLSLSRSTVKRAVKDLEKAGLIRKESHFRENGSATSNRYYLI